MFCFDFCLILFWFLFVLSLYIEIFYYEICLEAKKMVEKMWETSRKIAFSEHNQTLENIFQSIFWNATKHLKIFSFPENILHSTKRSLNISTPSPHPHTQTFSHTHQKKKKSSLLPRTCWRSKITKSLLWSIEVKHVASWDPPCRMYHVSISACEISTSFWCVTRACLYIFLRTDLHHNMFCHL